MEGKSQLISQLIVNAQQRLVLIIDETGREKHANRMLRQFLNEQDVEESNILTLPLNKKLRDIAYLSQFLADCRAHGKTQKKLNVVLPTLADLLCYMQPSMIFELLHELRNCAGVQCSFLWASTQYLVYSKINYLLAACEYVCDTVVHLLDEQHLNFTARKPGGGITFKAYNYLISKSMFLIDVTSTDEKNEEKNSTTSSSNVQTSPEHGSTFKIELEEEELVARNALKLPYEKTNETANGGGNIVYTPDASDDFDEEDPDEDLCI